MEAIRAINQSRNVILEPKSQPNLGFLPAALVLFLQDL